MLLGKVRERAENALGDHCKKLGARRAAPHREGKGTAAKVAIIYIQETEVTGWLWG